MAERDFTELMVAHYTAAEPRHLCAGVDISFPALMKHRTDGYFTPEEFPEGFDRNLTRGQVVGAYATRYIEALAAAEVNGEPVVAALKPNIQIARELKGENFTYLSLVRDAHHGALPKSALIADAKIEDIDTSNIGTTAEVFDPIDPLNPLYSGYDADAITVHIYLGIDALRSTVLKRTLEQGKGAFALDRTSNVPGARQFQDLWVTHDPDVRPTHQLYEKVAQEVVAENNQNIGLVVGATSPEESAKLRAQVGPRTHILFPGFGAQGGEVHQVIPVALRRGEWGVASFSRGLMYPKKREGENLWHAVTRATLEAHRSIVEAQVPAA